MLKVVMRMDPLELDKPPNEHWKVPLWQGLLAMAREVRRRWRRGANARVIWSVEDLAHEGYVIMCMYPGMKPNALYGRLYRLDRGPTALISIEVMNGTRLCG
jgi:hypothetical protein